MAKNTDYVASGINGELQSRIQLYKQPNCAFACGSFKAKELKLHSRLGPHHHMGLEVVDQ